jgi:uncharacterized protein (TIGR02996 family)
MSVDEAFIQDILAHPYDLGLRLIYADWLDERGDPRGTFLRAEAEYLALPPNDKRRGGTRRQLRQLASSLDSRWRKRLDLPLIENCVPDFEFVCPKRWQDLAETEQAGVRFCDKCEKNVYHCDTVREARAHAEEGHCVAVDTRQDRSRGDLRFVRMLLGRIAPPVRRPEPPDPSLPWRLGHRVTIIEGRHRGLRGEITRLHNLRRGAAKRQATVRLDGDGEPTYVQIRLDHLEPF